jgi:hypothetical protein
MISSTVLTLVVIPAVYSLWKERELRGRALRRRDESERENEEGEREKASWPVAAMRP